MPRHHLLIKLRLLLAFTAALLLLVLSPPQASAYMSPGEAVADPQVDAWLALAGATWGETPDCPEGLRIDRAQRVPAPRAWAAAEMPGCHISLDPDFYPAPATWTATADGRRQWKEQMCNVVVHEWGHLLGHDHATDAQDLMAASVPRVVPACRVDAPASVLTAQPTGKRKRAKRSRTQAGRSSKAAPGRPAARRSSHARVAVATGPMNPS